MIVAISEFIQGATVFGFGVVFGSIASILGVFAMQASTKEDQ